MSQNYNGYNVPPGNNSQNGFGELTNSLIFPGSFQPFQQLWQPAATWPPAEQENYNATHNYQNNNMVGPNRYFAAQQDFVAFDEGDDFYNNESEGTPMEQNTGALVTSKRTSIDIDNLFGDDQGAPRDSTEVSGTHTPDSNVLDQPPNHSNASFVEQASLNPHTSRTKQGNQERLAELRARLLSQKKVGGKTPTPESGPRTATKENVQPSSISAQPQEFSSKLPSNGLPVTGEVGVRNGSANSTVTNNIKQDAKSITKSSVPSVTDAPAPQPSHTSTDIDMLLAEARNTTIAKEIKSRPEKPSRHTSALQTPTNLSTPKSLPTAPPMNRQRSLNGSHVSSDASEMGEIREQPKRPERTPVMVPPESVAALDIPTKIKDAKSTPIQQTPSLQTSTAPSKQQPAKIDTSLANKQRVGSGTQSAKLKSPTSVRTPPTSNLRDLRDIPAVSDFRDQGDRFSQIKDRYAEAAWIASERRQDYDRERPREPNGRAYSREPYSRETRQYDQFRPNYTNRQHIIEENAREAAKYKRNLKLAKLEDRDVVMTESSPQTPNMPSKSSPTVAAAEYFADVDEWLEMTCYHDTTYRKKALARHRKLVQLDKERAELEREAQMEREEQSRLARAQSVKPKDDNESSPMPLRSAIASRVFSHFAMPPPPVPAKDNNDDVGIQIKDLAQRGAAATGTRAETGTQSIHDSPNPLTPTVKRQHSGDDYELREGRSLDKVPRTDSTDFNTEKKLQPKVAGAKTAATSLESRISVDNSAYRREYQQRSRSPDDRRRSPSPPSRRASGPEVRMRRQLSRGSFGSRSGYSPNRRPAYSREGSPSQADSSLAYDDLYDGSARRYNSYENRSNSGYDSYPANQRGGVYQQYIPAGSRGRGRGRGRGGYVNYRGNSYKPYDDAASR